MKIKNIVSSEVGLETGVGEGSVLGPNFFSCGMTDMSVVARRVMRKLEEQDVKVFITQIEYADNTTGILAADNEHDLQLAVDARLKGFSDYYLANGLKHNESKCHVMVFRPKKKIMDITCASMKEEPMLRLLGLFIDNMLEYDQHTKIICGRLVGKITHLEALKNKASFKTLKEVMMANIHSTIEFVAELYLREHKYQMLIQKKLNLCLKILMDNE